MTKNQAIEQAKNLNVEITVYFSPIDADDFDTDFWGYAPTKSIDIVARFREKEKDILILNTAKKFQKVNLI